MRRIFLFAIFSAVLFQSCEESLVNQATEALTVAEIAAIANDDKNVLRAFSLSRQISDARTEAILTGAILPDGPETAILATSTSVQELTAYLNDYNFANAGHLAELYAEQNALFAAFRIKYKPMVDKLSEVEKEELNTLLPSTSNTMTAEDAVKNLPTH